MLHNALQAVSKAMDEEHSEEWEQLKISVQNFITLWESEKAEKATEDGKKDDKKEN